jgi:hypothetical protein
MRSVISGQRLPNVWSIWDRMLQMRERRCRRHLWWGRSCDYRVGFGQDMDGFGRAKRYWKTVVKEDSSCTKEGEGRTFHVNEGKELPEVGLYTWPCTSNRQRVLQFASLLFVNTTKLDATWLNTLSVLRLYWTLCQWIRLEDCVAQSSHDST